MVSVKRRKMERSCVGYLSCLSRSDHSNRVSHSSGTDPPGGDKTVEMHLPDQDGGRDQGVSKEEETQKGAAPPDGGWGWVVAGGVFLIALVVPMLSPSFGILFSRQLLDWRASSTTVAVIFNAFLIVWRLTGIFVGSLAREFGFRRVAMMGTLLTAVCLALSAFATSPELLFIFFSLGCGLGSGLSCVGYLILAQYFKRHRGLANTCLMAGAAIGHFLSPLLIRVLQIEYGFKGATIIVGAIILHGFVGATLFHPVEWHARRPDTNTTPGDLEAVSSLLPQRKVRETSEMPACSDESTARLEEHTSVAKDKASFQRITKFQETGQCLHSLINSSGSRLTRNTPAACLATLADKSRPHTDDGATTLAHEGRETSSYTMCYAFRRVFRSVLKDMRILKYPSPMIIALGSTLVVNGEASFSVMVPFAIQAEGHSLQTAAWCVSLAGICSFLTRLCMSALSDFSWFNMRLCYMAGIATTGTSIIVFTLQNEVMWQATFVGVWGCAMGVFYGLNNLLMTRIVGLHNLTSMYGAKNLLGAVGFFSIGPLIGVIRDLSGSYAISMWVLSAFVFTSFILWLLMPVAQAYDRCMRTSQLPTGKSLDALQK